VTFYKLLEIERKELRRADTIAYFRTEVNDLLARFSPIAPPCLRAKGSCEWEAVCALGSAGVPGMLTSVPRRRHTRGDRSPQPQPLTSAAGGDGQAACEASAPTASWVSDPPRASERIRKSSLAQ
jgi:hypothetical protein